MQKLPLLQNRVAATASNWAAHRVDVGGTISAFQHRPEHCINYFHRRLSLTLPISQLSMQKDKMLFFT